MKKLLKITFTLFFTVIIVFGFALPLNPAGNWYQQFMPNLNGEPISDIYFLDSLTGFAVTGDGAPNDSNYILKTTNSGDNWIIKYTAYRDFFRIKFINQNTGFACGGFNVVGGGLFKTTNAGENWNQINSPAIIEFRDMAVIDDSTIWLVDDNSLNGGVYRTTNGGASWQNQLNLGSSNPEKVYMFNSRIGYISKNQGSSGYVRKTTDSGNSWSLIVSNDYFMKIHFTDSLTGWKNSVFGMKKTTDGGFNWVTQVIPFGGIIQVGGIYVFDVLNKDTLWGAGGYVLYPNSQVRELLYRTTNGGTNWLFQIPDTSIHISYSHMTFVNRLNGWVYDTSPRGIHTTTGGDPVWITALEQTSSEIPKEFRLFQNYPNPFNPRTVIPYKLKKASYVKLIAYDITGKEIQVMVNQRQQPGEYEVDFMGKFSASGVYFYRMEVTDDKSKQLYTEVKKMILLK